MKKIALFLFLVLFSFSLFSCSEDTDATTSSSTSTSTTDTDTSTSDTDDDYTLSVAFPKGAPAFAQTDIAYDIANGDITYAENTVLSSASEVKAAMTEGEDDLIYGAMNVGAQIYESNQSYTLLAGITFGNLYFVSTTEIDSLSDLNGMDVVLFGSGTVIDLVSEYVLDQNNITTNSTTFMSSTSDTKTALVANASANTVYLVADPIASAAEVALKSAGTTTYSISVEDEWETLTGYAGFAQAGLFVKTTTYEEHQGVVEKYLAALESSIDAVNDTDNASEENAKVTSLGYASLPDAVFESAIPGCNIRYETASSIKALFEATYSLDLDLVGGALPDEGFYQI